MQEFIDKTSEQEGTKINRKAMMAIQGFESIDTVFGDGSITETNADGHTLTTTFGDGVITETFVGEKTIIKTTTFNGDGNIMEVLGE